jgi:hypothetical protein
LLILLICSPPGLYDHNLLSPNFSGLLLTEKPDFITDRIAAIPKAANEVVHYLNRSDFSSCFFSEVTTHMSWLDCESWTALWGKGQ